MDRRAFLEMLVLAGLLPADLALAEDTVYAKIYDFKAPKPNSITLLHFTDTHAQLDPVWYREPNRDFQGSSFETYLYGARDFEGLAKRFGRVGGFAALATLIRRMKEVCPQALVLDGGDTWQGSALALEMHAADMVGAQQRLGVDVMTGHWEFTLGQALLKENLARLAPRTQFLAQNIRTEPFGDPVFRPWAMFEQNGVPYAVIGQAYPFVPIAHPRRFTEGWTFGIQEKSLQGHIDEAKRQGAKAVILLSHNGLALDLKLASRVSHLDLILGGHTHDPTPSPITVQNAGGSTWVTNAGSHGKFLSKVHLSPGTRGLELDFRLLPVLSDVLPPDPDMAAWIALCRRPFLDAFAREVLVAEELLYRRDRFEGSFDRIALKALKRSTGADMVWSPGFRWGVAKLSGEILTHEDVVNGFAVSYPDVMLQELTGQDIHARLEDIADNVFNQDPYYQEGGDMVRVGGLHFECHPEASFGQRIRSLSTETGALQASKRYRVASWASMNEGPSLGPAWACFEEGLPPRG